LKNGTTTTKFFSKTGKATNSLSHSD